MSSHAFIADSTVLRPQRTFRHAGHAESLAIQPSFGSEVLNDLPIGFRRIKGNLIGGKEGENIQI